MADKKLQWHLDKLEKDLAGMNPLNVSLSKEAALRHRIDLLKAHALKSGMQLSPNLEQIIRNTRYTLNATRGKRCIAEAAAAKNTKLIRSGPKKPAAIRRH